MTASHSWPIINVHYENAGDVAALGLALRTVVGIFGNGTPPAGKFLEIQDGLLKASEWASDLKSKEQEQTYPRDLKFTSIPSSPGPFADDFRASFAAIRDGKASVVVALTWKYRDESSANHLRVTEKCFWMSGGTFTQHDCGRNRTFLE